MPKTSNNLPAAGDGGSGEGDGEKAGGAGETLPNELVTSLSKNRGRIGCLIVLFSAILFLGIPALVAYMMWLLRLSDNPTTLDKVALVGSLQVGLGMYLGFFALFFGVAMTWIGIQEPAALKAEGKGSGVSGKVDYKSAGPGLLFAILGVILIGTSLHKQLEYHQGDDGNAKETQTTTDKDTNSDGSPKHTRKK